MQELTPLILAIHMEPSRLMRLAFTAAALKIRVLPVDQTSWGQPLGALCGLMPLRSTSSSVQVGEEMLEAVLDQHGIFYNKTEVWIESEKLYEVLYSFETEV